MRTGSSGARRWRPGLAALVALAAACGAKLRPEYVGGVQVALPNWKDSVRSDDPAAGFLERRNGSGSVLVAWDADARSLPAPGDQQASPSPLSPDEALAASGLAKGHDEGRGPPVDGHPSELVEAGGARALVWRCDRSGRILRVVAQGSTPSLEVLAAQVRCHGPGQRPVNGDVPAASSAALGAGFRLAHRGPASATYLRDDAVLVLFAGQRTDPPRDLVEAAHLAPGWGRAAGLDSVVVKSGGAARGPQQHPATRVIGTATLDGRPVRFALLTWGCIQRARSYVALVVAQVPAASRGQDAPAKSDTSAEGDWTGHDSVLLAARCHG